MIAHLWNRLAAAKARLTPVEPRYRIVWEDPAEPDAPVKISIPDPHWLAAALAGGVLPPVEAYLQDATLGTATHPYWPARDAMSEEKAMEYLVQKDIPPRVWRDYRGNRQVWAIVRAEAVPVDRTNRNAWRLEDLAA